MFKRILILVGVFFLWGGFDNYFNYSEEINEEALDLSFSKLEEIIRGDEKTYIRYEGSLDPTGRIYRSFLKRPPYSGFAPRDVQELSLSELSDPREVQRHLGALIQVNGSFDSAHIVVQWIREKDGERLLQGVSVLAPLAGTRSSVWAMSPVFRPDDSEKKNAWLSKPAHTGRLSRFSDLDVNVKNLENSFEEISQKFLQAQSQYISPSALLLLGHRPMMLEGDLPREKFYALVEETDLKLYVRVNEAEAAEIEKSGEIVGVLDPEESSEYADFRRVLLEDSFPKRIGIVTGKSGKELNDKNFKVTMIGIVGGLLMISLGGYLLAREKS